MLPDSPDQAHPPARAATPHLPPPIPDHELLRCIGVGGYGEVWLARNVVGTLRAVKVVYRDAFGDDPRPYEREFEGIRKFEPLSRSHDGLVDILQIGINQPAGYFYYVMELADAASVRSLKGEVQGSRNGGAADDPPTPEKNSNVTRGTMELGSYVPKTLKSEICRQGRLPYHECLRVSLALADALEHLHRHGLIHRDIKPSNIIFVNGVTQLADIGLVAQLGEAKSMVGTEGFMAPEGPGTTQADLYSLGKVFYEMATGKDRRHFPEPLTNLAELTDLPQWLEFNEVVHKACEPEPSKRYSSTTQLRADLLLLQSGRSVRRLRLAERRRRQAIYAAVTVVVIAMVALSVQRTIQSRTHQRLLLQQIEQIRLTVHSAGWSDQIWTAASNAARIRVSDEVRVQAASTLAGLDARVVKRLTNLSASAVAFDAQGRRLLIGGYGTNATRLLDLETGQMQPAKQPRAGPVAFSADGSPLQFSTNETGSFVLWDVAKDQSVREFGVPSVGHAALPVPSPPLCLAIGAEAMVLGAAVAQAGGTDGIAVWDAADGKVLREILQPATTIAFSPDNKLLAVGDDRGTITLWPLPVGPPRPRLRSGRMPITGLAFSRDYVQHEDPSGPARIPWLLAAGDQGGTVTLWELASGTPRNFYRAGSIGISALAFSPDGMVLVAGGRIPTRLWDVPTGRLLLQINSGDPLSGVAFSPDGKQLAVASTGAFYWAGETYLWALDHGRGVQSLRGLSAKVSFLCVSPNGHRLAAMAINWQVGLWDSRTGDLFRVVEAPRGASADNAALCFSPDGRQLAFATAGAAKLWDVATGQELRSWKLRPGLQEHLAFDASGRLLLLHTETRDETDWPFAPASHTVHPRVCRLFDLSDDGHGRPLLEIEDFNQRVASIALSADGCRAVISGRHEENGQSLKLVKAFDLPGGTPRWTFYPTGYDPPDLMLDSSGRYVLFDIGVAARVVVEWATGRVLRTVPSTFGMLGLAAESWLSHDPELTGGRGLAVMVEGHRRPRVVLAIDTLPGSPAALEGPPTAALLLWGHDDGTVFVAEVNGVNRCLAEIGLGW